MPALDRFITEFDIGLRTLFSTAHSHRPHPDAAITDTPALTEAERLHAGRLMRINHVGEVCAQALYQGQALTARNPDNRDAFRQAAFEETEHLAWTEQRIAALGGRKSLLNPLWYTGSLAIGLTAGLLGDKWSLGFLAETEHQVADHLNAHLNHLPAADTPSLAIVTQMRDDELAHARLAENSGAAPLPPLLKRLMKSSAKLMTRTSYWV